MSYGDEGYVVGDEQQYSDDQLESINSSVIRHGHLRCALVERKNELDVEKPGEKVAKRCRHRVDKKIQDGVPMSKSGSGFAEFVAVSSYAAKGPKPKLKPTQRIKSMTARDWDALSDDDQEDFVKPREAEIEAHQEPAAKRQNKGKLLSASQAAGALIDILEHRVQHNEICERVRLAVSAPAPAQHATASEYPEGWQYLSIPVFPYVGVAEYLGINTPVLQYCSIASVGAKISSETEEVPRI